jgi:hypothetical protein
MRARSAAISSRSRAISLELLRVLGDLLQPLALFRVRRLEPA